MARCCLICSLYRRTPNPMIPLNKYPIKKFWKSVSFYAFSKVFLICLVVVCLLSVVVYLLFVVVCLLFVCCLLLFICCLLLFICCLCLFVCCCCVFVVCCCLLFFVCCFLLFVCCLLLFVVCFSEFLTPALISSCLFLFSSSFGLFEACNCSKGCSPRRWARHGCPS